MKGDLPLFSRDRIVTLAALLVATLLCWFYLYRMTAGVSDVVAEHEMHAAMGMADMAAWGPAELFGLFVMWMVMMAGMMLPSATPVILLVLKTYRRRGGRDATWSTLAFALGYLVTWTGFSVVAASLQALLHRTAIMSADMMAQSAVISAAIFLIAGIYQWVPAKAACLTHCRTPLHFLTHEWREGTLGGFTMGARHGLFCVGCCWALMLLLFAVGVMNLFWVAAISAFVLLEKLLPRGMWFSRVAGATCIVWAAYLLLSGLS
jgi:predicted metal-binding membrane protein